MGNVTVLILGAGAVGCLYGAKLQQAGAEVSLVCRSDYELARERGIQVDSCWGDVHLKPANVYRSCAETDAAPDFLFVALKVLPEIDRVSLMQEAVGPGTSIVLFQNGIEIEEEVAAAFPDNEVISGLAFVCCNRVGPARFDHLDYGHIKLGCYPAGISDRLEELGQLFAGQGVPTELDDDIQRSRWWKLVWNAPFNPMSVLGGGVTTSDMLADDSSRQVIRLIMEEVRALSVAAGKGLPESVVDEMMEATRKMTPYKTSMLLDYEARRPMEVEAILGNAVRAARRMQVATPHLDTIYALLSLADHANR